MSPRKMYFGGLLLYIPFCHRVHARRTDAHSSDITVLSIYAHCPAPGVIALSVVQTSGTIVCPPPARAAGRNAPLIRFFISALHIVLLLYIVCFPLILFLHCFLTFLRPYLSFPLRIDPLRFQAGCRRRRLKLALVLLRLFCVVVHLFWLANACFCCVRLSFFPHQAKRLAWGNVSEMTCFVSSGT